MADSLSIKNRTSLFLKSKTVLFYDHGLFTHFALTLGRYFGRVLYFSPYSSAFPTTRMLAPGSGYKEMERVEKFWDAVDGADLIVFADIYDGDLQAWLRRRGKRVWGCGAGEELEINRWGAKTLLREARLPMRPVKRIVGLPTLREFLRGNEDKFVKISRTRGDMETFHHVNYTLSEVKLAMLEEMLGPFAAEKEFVVEEPVRDAVEAGYDGYCIRGEFPKIGLLGYEIKDCGFLGAVRNYEELPEPVRLVNERLAPQLEAWDYRGHFSTEVRVTKDGKGFLIDPTCRMAAPPSELYEEIFSNWGEILWRGAEGVCVDPKPVAKFGVEAVIYSDWARDHWQPILIPPKVRQWVKLRNGCRAGGMDYVAPQFDRLELIGAVVGLGDSIEEATAMCKRIADQVRGPGIEIKLDSITHALKEIADGERRGVDFSDKPLPEPAEILEEIL